MEIPIGTIEVSAYVIPTATPESDGTFEWISTTLVVVEATAGNQRGLGYTYADTATARLISDRLIESIGEKAELFVDANGAYERKQALDFAERFATYDVTWFEEPVSSDDIDGLRLLRDRAPAGMDIAAGEYGYDLFYFRRMLEGGAVDVLQPDATRCAGFTEFLRVSALCDAHNMALSGHTAPSLHLHICCATPPARHIEYFFDHARIEEMLFDGFRKPIAGEMTPDLSRPGIGVELKRSDAERFATIF